MLRRKRLVHLGGWWITTEVSAIVSRHRFIFRPSYYNPRLLKFYGNKGNRLRFQRSTLSNCRRGFANEDAATKKTLKMKLPWSHRLGFSTPTSEVRQHSLPFKRLESSIDQLELSFGRRIFWVAEKERMVELSWVPFSSFQPQQDLVLLSQLLDDSKFESSEGSN